MTNVRVATHGRIIALNAKITNSPRLWLSQTLRIATFLHGRNRKILQKEHLVLAEWPFYFSRKVTFLLRRDGLTAPETYFTVQKNSL